MSFSDYSFDFAENGSRLSFPGHEKVLKFLNNFAKEFGIIELIRFNTEVVRVAFGENGYVVESKSEDLISEEEFESILICNGHFTMPRVADIPEHELYYENYFNSLIKVRHNIQHEFCK